MKDCKGKAQLSSKGHREPQFRDRRGEPQLVVVRAFTGVGGAGGGAAMPL